MAFRDAEALARFGNGPAPTLSKAGLATVRGKSCKGVPLSSVIDPAFNGTANTSQVSLKLAHPNPNPKRNPNPTPNPNPDPGAVDRV